jgi:hypothetical protein
MTVLRGYDWWLEAPYDRDDMWVCGCGMENNGGEVCVDCDVDCQEEPMCRNGRCGYCARCDAAADEGMDR